MLTPAQVLEFETNGYVAGGQVLSDDEVETLRAEVLRVIDGRSRTDVPQPVMCHNMGKPDAPVWQIVNIWMASKAFKKLVSHPTICEEVAQLHAGARGLRMWHDQIQYKPAGKGGVNMWHQDSPYWGILMPKDAQVTAWVALDDVDESNGCMSMVPHSHRWGNTIEFLHTLKTFDEMKSVKAFRGQKVEVIPRPVSKGHVHYHHSLTWHGSHANSSDRPRRAIALHYMTDQTRYVGKGDHVMKRFVDVSDGERMRGEFFPLVWGTGE
ncbi:MAG TPA: phytanoyl-CoA dioxygenase family protein [Tepidisphaeraceae bacterium]|jgi:ectoine hydroxylase-related dioxygenase (phytanoyl-CoA dioxygenase family)